MRIETIGDLRSAINGLQDDAQVLFQVIGYDKSDPRCWIMGGSFEKIRDSDPQRYVITLEHPLLQHLPSIEIPML